VRGTALAWISLTLALLRAGSAASCALSHLHQEVSFLFSTPALVKFPLDWALIALANLFCIKTPYAVQLPINFLERGPITILFEVIEDGLDIECLIARKVYLVQNSPVSFFARVHCAYWLVVDMRDAEMANATIDIKMLSTSAMHPPPDYLARRERPYNLLDIFFADELFAAVSRIIREPNLPAA
jgi:hypothetical protein